MYDLIIKNGCLTDKASGLNGIADIAVSGKTISEVGPDTSAEAKHVIDAKGCIVTPGLIDMHAHLYPFLPTGIPAEATCFSTGVTTAVDAGSAGCGTYTYLRDIIRDSKLRIKTFLNVCTAGIIAHPIPEDVNPAGFDKERIEDVLARYDSEIMGLKVRISREITGQYGIKPLVRTAEIADELGVPFMVHPTNPPCSMADIIDILRPGDFLSHTYHNIGPTILDENGRVCDSAVRGRERGVLFDVANDGRHFGYSTARAAIDQGFLPDVITSDLTIHGLFNYPTVFSLPMLLSKYMALGLSLEDVIELATSAPARIMGIDSETGSLKSGMCADISVFRLIDREASFSDRPDGGAVVTVGKILKPMMTVRDGCIVFRDAEI